MKLCNTTLFKIPWTLPKIYISISQKATTLFALTEYKQNLKMVEPEEVEQIYF